MQIRFADRRPTGDYALVLPVAGKDRSTLGVARSCSAGRVAQRSTGSGSKATRPAHRSSSSMRTAASRRLLVVGIGSGACRGDAAEKAGRHCGRATADLGRKDRPSSTSAASDYDADAAARVGLARGAPLVALRPLSDQAEGQSEADARRGRDRRRRCGAGKRYEQRWAPVVEGVSLTRELVTEPANIIYPETFVERVRASLEGQRRRDRGARPRGDGEARHGRAARRRSGLGARGAAADPHVERRRGRAEPTAFVGKGVTFDTGGISIKPAAGMEAMKWDMGGAGAVAGAMKALALRKAKANIVGICGLVENMPGGNAQRPGDVVTTMSGQTVEVINTDAEGRLVLADAITYVQRNFKPTTIIDLATLTGAILISLGHEWAGLFSNNEELAAGAAEGGR